MTIRRFCFLLLTALLPVSIAPVLPAQTSVAASVYGAFGGATSGNGTAQSPSNAAGGLIELRHISNPLVGYEASYSFNRANQHYEANYSCPAAGSTCPAPLPITVPANAHQIALNWVVSAHVMNIRPFALAGVGVLLDEVSGSPSGSSSTVKPVYIYGAGVDWGLLPHIGLRLQYRGNLYKAPDLAGAFSSTDRFAHTGQPMIGAYFRF
ncbi:MAG TPA: outer membrane beta-barrel protein [Terracidiphilus sp.]